MADNVAVTAGSGTTIAADEVSDATLGTAKVQYVKLMDGTLDGTAKAKILAASTAPAATDPAIVVAISPNSVNSNGQKTMDNSSPVVLASNQSSIPVTVPVGQQAMASSTPVVLASNQSSIPVTNTVLTTFGTGYYVACSASATTVLQSSAGATGDFVNGLLIIPGTTSPGSVALVDNATSTTVFTGGASSVSNLVPFYVPLNAVSRSGAWSVVTGANVTVVATGKFS